MLKEELEKIRKLPKLKDGYHYEVSNIGKVGISSDVWYKDETGYIILYKDFGGFVEDDKRCFLRVYEDVMASPVYDKDGYVIDYE